MREGDQRVVAGINRGIDGHDVLVWTAAVQYADGSLRQPAQVHVELGHDDAMTADQARALAAELIEAADEIDRWAKIGPTARSYRPVTLRGGGPNPFPAGGHRRTFLI